MPVNYLGPRLVAVAHTTTCDACGERFRLISDGLVAVLSPDSIRLTVRDVTVYRDGVTLSAACPAVLNRDVHHEGDPCTGALTWRLDTDSWTVNGNTLAELDRHGEPVHREQAHG